MHHQKHKKNLPKKRKTSKSSFNYDKAISKLILHPDVNLIKLNDMKYILKLDEKKKVFLEVDGGVINVSHHMYSLGFNNLVRTTSLEINIINFVCKTTFKWH